VSEEPKTIDVTHEQVVNWCLSCVDGLLTDEQHQELRSRIETCLEMKDGDKDASDKLPW